MMAATVASSTRPTIRTRQSRTDQRPSSAKIFRKLLIVIPGTPPTSEDRTSEITSKKLTLIALWFGCH